MADQAQAEPVPRGIIGGATVHEAPSFRPRGEPVFRGINRVGLSSLYIKEVRRFLKVQTQTIWGPAVSTVLFLVIFDVALGRADRTVLGVSFADFIAHLD